MQNQRLFEVHPWKLISRTLEVENHRLQESLTSIGNGYMGMRGNYEETYSGDKHQGTYLAGVWFPDKTRVGWWKNGYPEYFGKVINALNFISIDIKINEVPVDLGKINYKDFYLELNMENGELVRSYIVEQEDVVVKLAFRRFLSIVTPELSFQKVTATVLSGRGEIEISSNIDGNVQNQDANYEEVFWIEKATGNKPFSYVTTETIENPFGIERFSVTAMMKNEASLDGEKISGIDSLRCSEKFPFELNAGDVLEFTKKVVVLTSRDVAESEQVIRGTHILVETTETYEEALAAQTAAWEKRWEIADVEITGNDEAQQGIRFNLFQLFSTYYGTDKRLNIGPKGFTGEKYGGATYWDTEAYAIPLYLAVAKPEVTKNLLKYRHDQLPQAQHNARQQGLKGALYPMVTFTGIECHNEWEITFEEIHRNGAIAYGIYNYTNYTGDTSYIEKEGLEVLTEISRFWADRVHYSKRNRQYMIHGVTGPNEYENNINNNWYTNTMAAWVLQYTMENYRKYQRTTIVEISEEELAKWQDIVDNMYYPYDEALQVFVQHDTFLDKDLMKVSELDPVNLPLNQNWSWDRILRSCFIKQADVLQGLYFFGDKFTIDEKRRNFDFYEPMTVHESSLSPSVHGVLAAELGKEAKAEEMYARTARLDLDNYNRDTDDGLHITSMTGSWLAIVQGFAQMKTWHEELSFAPFVPKSWGGYAFHVNYRGRLLKIAVANEVAVTLLSGDPLEIKIYNEKQIISDTLKVPVKQMENQEGESREF